MISIITSLYKSENYLRNFFINFEIFLNKFEKNEIELIIIANDSSEKEKKLLESFALNNSVLRLFFVKRESLYTSWNRGVQLANGQIITFWNVDDVRYAEAVKNSLDLFMNGADLVYFPFIYRRYLKILEVPILVKRKIIKPLLFDKIEFTRSMHCGPFFMFKKDFFKKVGPFDEQFKIAGDFDWCVRSAQIGNFVLSTKIAGVFKNAGTSLSGSKNPIHIAENNLVYLRNNIKDKILKVDASLESQYFVDKILINNSFIKIN